MRILVEDAMRLWRGIPPERLSEAVELGIVAAGNFLATAGGVAKAWQDRNGKEAVADFVALGMRDAEMRKALPADTSPAYADSSEDEKKEIQRQLYRSIGMPVPEHLR